jgi:hypothetical protein
MTGKIHRSRIRNSWGAGQPVTAASASKQSLLFNGGASGLGSGVPQGVPILTSELPAEVTANGVELMIIHTDTISAALQVTRYLPKKIIRLH